VHAANVAESRIAAQSWTLESATMSG
jgi:hypothetical protein